MKIALVSPHTRFLTKRLPLGLMFISSYLTSKNIENDIVDIKGFNLNKEDAFEKTIHKLKELKPNIVGIGCYVTEIFEIKKLCLEIRKMLPKAFIVLGGPHPSYRPEDFIKIKVDFDYIVIGEGEDSFYELILAIKEKKDKKLVKGIAYIENNQIIRTEPRALIENLDKYPMPAYEKVDMEYYTKPSVWAIRPVLISAVWVFYSRGCPYNCKFCVAHTLFGRTVRHRSPQKVVEEIEFLVNKYKIDGLFFGDETFTIKREKVFEICKELRRKKVNIIWSCSTRAHLLQEDVVREMKKSGCIQIDFGIESGSKKILDIINKQTTIEDYERASKICKKVGIRQFANMLINVPGETWDDLNLSLNLVKRLGYNCVIWNVYVPIPGVCLGTEMDMGDYSDQLVAWNSLSYGNLEKRYKFGNYKDSIATVLLKIYQVQPFPRNIYFSLNPLYFYRLIKIFSFIFNLKYIIKILTSKRKKDYIKAVFTFSNMIKTR